MDANQWMKLIVYVYNQSMIRFSESESNSKYNQSQIMDVSFNKQLQTILVAFQLAFFTVLSILSSYKMIISKNNNARFLFAFYLLVLIDCLAYISMMLYQIIDLTADKQIHMIILVMTNVYSMIMEATIISFLSFYWKETQAILRGSGLDTIKSVNGIKNQLKVKGSIFAFWLLIYTAFLIYSVITNNQINSDIYKDIFYFGGQGFTTFLLIWANFSQVVNAKKFSFTLKRYQTLVSYQMNRTKFRCIYWVASSINLIRLGYLIVAAVFFRIKTQNESSQWVGMFIYTASGLIPLSIYLYSFQVSQQKPRNSFISYNEIDVKSQMDKTKGYEPPQILSPFRNKKEKVRESPNLTQLSSSYDSHGI